MIFSVAQISDGGWWLLNRIASGEGKPVPIVCHIKRDEALLEALEDDLLIVVGSGTGVHEFRASIVDRGRSAIKTWRASQVELIVARFGRCQGKKS